MIQELEVELPRGMQRVESGPVQFNSDWPGVFIRGDHCLHYQFELSRLIEDLEEQARESKDLTALIRLNMLTSLRDTLASCMR